MGATPTVGCLIPVLLTGSAAASAAVYAGPGAVAAALPPGTAVLAVTVAVLGVAPSRPGSPALRPRRATRLHPRSDVLAAGVVLALAGAAR